MSNAKRKLNSTTRIKICLIFSKWIRIVYIFQNLWKSQNGFYLLIQEFVSLGWHNLHIKLQTGAAILQFVFARASTRGHKYYPAFFFILEQIYHQPLSGKDYSAAMDKVHLGLNVDIKRTDRKCPRGRRSWFLQCASVFHFYFISLEF